jgi:hypothetical protein
MYWGLRQQHLRLSGCQTWGRNPMHRGLMRRSLCGLLIAFSFRCSLRFAVSYEITQSGDDFPHASGVQSAVFFKLTVYSISLGGFGISERNPKELTAGGVAIPNGEILVAPVREGWKDGLHGGAAVLSGVVVSKGSKWLC